MYTVNWNTEFELGENIGTFDNLDEAVVVAKAFKLEHPERNVYICNSEVNDAVIWEE